MTPESRLARSSRRKAVWRAVNHWGPRQLEFGWQCQRGKFLNLAVDIKIVPREQPEEKRPANIIAEQEVIFNAQSG